MTIEVTKSVMFMLCMQEEDMMKEIMLNGPVQGQLFYAHTPHNFTAPYVHSPQPVHSN